MKWNVGTKIAVGFGLALAIFVIVGAVSFRSTSQLIAASDLRKHTNEVLSRLAELETQAADMQNGVRGYAITGEETYLEPYQAALGRIDEVIRDIRKLTADNLRQQQRLDALEPSVKSRIDLAREIVDAVRTGGPEAGVQLVKTARSSARWKTKSRNCSNNGPRPRKTMPKTRN